MVRARGGEAHPEDPASSEDPGADDDGHAGIAAHEAELLARVAPGGGFLPREVPTGCLARGVVIAGCYRLVQVLGEGATGEVWLAEHEGERSLRAIKFLRGRGRSDEQLAARFEREAKLLAHVVHPHVVRVFEVGHTPELGPYLVLEYVLGRSLAELLHGGALEASSAVELVAQLGEAIDAIHRGGVLHRDLKPANILISGAGAHRVVKLIDFGLARGDLVETEPAALTSQGQIIGTPHYMSPEQFRGDPVDARSDLYALGCIVFEILAGRRPFPGRTLEELGFQHVKVMPPPVFVGGLDGPSLRAVQAVMRRALAKVPSERFATGAELTEALRRALRSRSASATSGGVLAQTPFEGLVARVRAPWPIGRVVVGLCAAAAFGYLARELAVRVTGTGAVASSPVDEDRSQAGARDEASGEKSHGDDTAKPKASSPGGSSPGGSSPDASSPASVPPPISTSQDRDVGTVESPLQVEPPPVVPSRERGQAAKNGAKNGRRARVDPTRAGTDASVDPQTASPLRSTARRPGPREALDADLPNPFLGEARGP